VKNHVNEHFDKDGKNILLEKLSLLEKGTFRLPSFTAYPSGWKILDNGQMIKFNLISKELSYGERKLIIRNKNMKEVLSWLDEDLRTSGLWDLVISSAYAQDAKNDALIVFAMVAVAATEAPKKSSEDCSEALAPEELADCINQQAPDRSVDDSSRGEILERGPMPTSRPVRSRSSSSSQ
jgi:hypothetical protein